MAERDIPILGPLINRIVGSRNDRFVKKYNQRVDAINAREASVRKLSDAELRGKLGEFRARFDKGEKADEIMIDAFAVAREAMDRAVGIRNIFNPEGKFDPSVLPAAAREVYARVKAEMDAREPVAPAGEWLGFTEPVPGWRQVDIPVELYEAVREVYKESRPPYRARPFDVQLIGGMVLGQGKIAEMKTGEGKTIVGPLACYMACVERNRVHVVTVNDYLVQRDRDWTAPYFHALGLTVGAIHPQHMQDEGMKRQMYACDVVYGTTSEFGFDYLRDNMKRRVEEQVQKKRQFAIVDEVDSTLIDEARTPLIISGPAHEDAPRYELADRLARHLKEKQRPWDQANEAVEAIKLRIKGTEGDMRQLRDKTRLPELQAAMAAAKKQLPELEAARDQHKQYFEVKMERKSAHLTHEGVTEAQRVAGIGSFYVDQNIDVPHLLEQSVRAHTVYELDRDYVVMEAMDQMTGRKQPSIVIVDTNTGRPMIGRQWSDGLHQAIECKEKVPIKQETQTVATITIQNFFKMYKRLAGMTGTADTEAQEFNDIYKLDVVSIPTNKPVVRRDYDDLIFISAKDKWNFIVDEIKAFHDVGRPILVGTTSVEKSETLSKMLQAKHQIKHDVLNAKQHEREAHIVENAGVLGQVMIATNMAGRGTDIKLQPLSREAQLDHWLRRGIAPRTVTVDMTDEQLREHVYRKIASTELEGNKRDYEQMPWAELELKLLQHWAMKHTWLGDRAVRGASAEQLREAIDKQGRFLLHRLRWFTSTEDMGGLHVIGTERHESRRIDNQLRGRSGRQGDKGSSRFFVSFEDDLMKLFAGEAVQRLMALVGMKEGDFIENPMVSKRVEGAQRKVEQINFERRKNILEYDEVMEHQRQTFYGLRQRVLEGRDVKGLIFEYLQDSVADAVDTYLDNDYRFQCAAEYALQKLDCSIPIERLRGKDVEELEKAIRAEAKYDARHSIDITLGEYMPSEGSEVSVDVDTAGLISWAKTKYGVELDPHELHGNAQDVRKRVASRLEAAAYDAIEGANLSGLAAFTAPEYGATQLAEWVKNKFGFEVSASELIKASKGQTPGVTPDSMIMAKAEELYERREIEYPVEFGMDMTQQLMRMNPQEGAAHFIAWANTKYKLGWTMDIFKTNSPQQVKAELIKASELQYAEKRLEADVAKATATKTDDELAAFFKERFELGLPDTMRYLTGEERANAIRSRIENLLRGELLHFERTILLDTLDTSWKDHLYAMDQLRDTINFRAFSQSDPRIEYKREGSQMFKSMLQSVRDRITDYVFKARITPGGGGGGGGMPRRAPAPMAPPRSVPNVAPAGTPLSGGGMISGPGLA
jgi:preprotein translocase subunit SecA